MSLVLTDNISFLSASEVDFVSKTLVSRKVFAVKIIFGGDGIFEQFVSTYNNHPPEMFGDFPDFIYASEDCPLTVE